MIIACDPPAAQTGFISLIGSSRFSSLNSNLSSFKLIEWILFVILNSPSAMILPPTR